MPTERDRKGQVLVLVALGLIALVAVVALAVDGGHLYAERRKMQNAADAGALAGARMLCFESSATHQDIIDEATLYAVDRNGAHGAEVSIGGTLTVTVRVTETANTFFASVIGFREVEVAADATAMCQGPLSAGGLWPLAVSDTIYTGNEVPCGALFYAFVNTGKNWTVDDCDMSLAEIENFAPSCGIDISNPPVALPGGDRVGHIGPGERGWLRFPEPEPPFPKTCNSSCGANELNCWLRNQHPGPITVGDCIPGKPGGNESTSNSIEGTNPNNPNHAYQICEVRNLVLFDDNCANPTIGTCPAAKDRSYRVSGFGCVKILGMTKVTIPGSPSLCPNKETVIVVQKMCETYRDADNNQIPMEGYTDNCISGTGGGTGGAPLPTDVIVVQLID